MKHPRDRFAEDVELATLYRESFPDLDRGRLGLLLEREGLGVDHYLHSGLPDRIEYINRVLDKMIAERAKVAAFVAIDVLFGE